MASQLRRPKTHHSAQTDTRRPFSLANAPSNQGLPEHCSCGSPIQRWLSFPNSECYLRRTELAALTAFIAPIVCQSVALDVRVRADREMVGREGWRQPKMFWISGFRDHEPSARVRR